MCAHLFLWELQNCNSLLNKHQQENVVSYQKKDTLLQEQRTSANNTVGGVKSHLESNPISARDAERAQTKPCVCQDTETPQRLSEIWLWVSRCLQWRRGSAVAYCRHRCSCCSRPQKYGMWHKSSSRRSPLIHYRAAEKTTYKLENNSIKEVLALLQRF